MRYNLSNKKAIVETGALSGYTVFSGRSILLLSFILALFCLACSEQNSNTGLFQDKTLLNNSNGLIVKQQLLKHPYENTSIYKIRYMSDSLEVIGFIATPESIQSKFPVIIYNRGGNREFGKITEQLFRYFSFLCSHGYVVIASQYRGNDGGEGQDEFGGRDVNDILNLFPLIESLPFADKDKVVMLGFSRGGMMTYLAIKEGAPLKAAAVVGGISDLILAGKNRPNMKDMMEYELIGTDENEYLKRSAVYWPEKLTVPLLIVHGSEDWRANVAQATVLATKLDSLNYDHQLVVIEGGDHGLSAHKKQRNNLIFDWFTKYLD